MIERNCEFEFGCDKDLVALINNHYHISREASTAEQRQKAKFKNHVRAEIQNVKYSASFQFPTSCTVLVTKKLIPYVSKPFTKNVITKLLY